jgi:hypothetical protein
MAKLAAEASDQVLSFVKATGLDFKIVETPFSLEIEIKKKFIMYNPGSKPKTTFSKVAKDVKPNSQINPKPFSNSSQPKNVPATSTLFDVMAKPMDSCTQPLPFLTSHYGTMVTSSPFMINPTSTVENSSSNPIPMPQATLFKVPKPGQAMNSCTTMKLTESFQIIERG